MSDSPRPTGDDPLAVALANASLLGIGYLFLGRRGLAVVTGLVTLVLAVLLASVVQAVWFEIIVVLWWAALIAHGWTLAARGPVRRRRRLIAAATALPVLLTVGVLRFDASGIEEATAKARGSGDCARALAAQRRVWFGQRVADAPLAARGNETVQACRRIAAAEDKLAAALSGDVNALRAGFHGLTRVLADLPGHEEMVRTVLDGFLRRLPAGKPCATAAITDELLLRRARGNVLDGATAIVPQTAPAALVRCGDDTMTAEDWASARMRYQQMLDEYPGHGLRGKAEDGVERATLAGELAQVRALLGERFGDQPEYCSEPAKYSGAAPYGKGTNRAFFAGDDEYTGRLPGTWRTTDIAKAVLVVCVDEREYGKVAQTCPYTGAGTGVTYVTFRKIAVPVKAYELRTGKRVADRELQIGGRSCPSSFSYSSVPGLGSSPPSKKYVKPSTADIRAAFGSLITR
ncbi:hypothetical protein [Actinomadura rugatobispora]|uniref:Uncharacterized protein n=1 Tax=Actinomadura rugatobispora TaxID=1994 RepID=A0ABW1AA02_9ACTN|nr:hypothetical protein GCM10010200_046110 [Actinomadura rugatobispora]